MTREIHKKTMGYVCYQRWVNSSSTDYVDELALNPEFWLGWPVAEVLSTLVHEQCHIWQNAFGRPGRGRYHNQEWADKMISFGLIPSDTGRPGGRQTGDRISDYVQLNGLCHKYIVKWLEQTGGLVWLDCCPISPKLTSSVFDSSGSGYNLDGTPFQQDYTGAEQGISVAGSDATMQVAGMTSYAHQEVAHIAAKNPQTRLKYSCSGCGINIWGKPDINVICGDCNLEFAAV